MGGRRKESRGEEINKEEEREKEERRKNEKVRVRSRIYSVLGFFKKKKSILILES